MDTAYDPSDPTILLVRVGVMRICALLRTRLWPATLVDLGQFFDQLLRALAAVSFRQELHMHM